MAEFNVWLLILGLAAGAAVALLINASLSRSEDDIASVEQAAEAAWIARLIEEHGGRAPVALVVQILELHRRYLKGGAGVPLPEELPADEPPADESAAATATAAEPDPEARERGPAERADERARTPAG